MSKWFQTRRLLWEFPIGSFVKLSSALAAILVGGLKCRTHFWKGTTQGSLQQNLVEIGSVVSEKIFFINFIPPFFLFLAWWPSWLEVGITGHNFGRGPPKEHSTKVWLQLAQWFLRRRLKCEMLTDGRKVMQGFQYFSSVTVLHYLQAVLFFKYLNNFHEYLGAHQKRSFSLPVSLFKSVFFSPIIILFLQYSHKRSSHVPEI